MAYYNIDHVETERLIRAAALLSELLFTAGAKKILLPFNGLEEINGPDEITKIYLMTYEVPEAGCKIRVKRIVVEPDRTGL